ncbi:hypothetical protein [Roseateles sp. BYS87W]|uniref:DUF3298 domain-containing protein n=1 Tax=Pelomonas baiyunensis TaxID=3299026 RepID=A0ABW7H0S5_9BURK
MKFLLCAALFCGIAHAAGSEPELLYRQAEYRIGAADANNAMAWSYPVVLPLQTPAHQRLNAWLREQALEIFQECDIAATLGLRAMPDRKLVEVLNRTPAFWECGLLQSTIAPREAFGRYVSFEVFTEYGGNGVRPLHGVKTLVFDMVGGAAVDLASLFKPGALEELNYALAKQMAKDRKRWPDCPGRKFDWSLATLRPPADLLLTFPHDPMEWSRCGDGVAVLSGRVVRAQLAQPALLQPSRRWVKQNPS